MSDLIVVHENSQVHSKERKEQIKVIDKFSKNITLSTEKLIPAKEKTSSPKAGQLSRRLSLGGKLLPVSAGAGEE